MRLEARPDVSVEHRLALIDAVADALREQTEAGALEIVVEPAHPEPGEVLRVVVKSELLSEPKGGDGTGGRLMTPSQSFALGSVLAFLGFISLIWAASWLVSDKRARRKAEQTRKHVTIVDPLAPSFQLPRLHHDCASCRATFIDPPTESFQACPLCGTPWARSYSVADAQPTDEPPTLPGAA